MGSRHLDFTIQDIHDEQRSIDGIVKSLLNFTPGAVSSSSANKNNENLTSGARTPIPGTRGRGRPRTKLPSGSPSQSKPVSGPTLESVIECLNKLNSQNKRLLNFVDYLSEKVEKYACTHAAADDGAPNEIREPSSENNVLQNVNNRLEKIEQNLNSNILICRGAGVPQLIAGSADGNSTNFERLKGEVCRAICGDDVTGVDVGNLQVGHFGRDKKAIKVVCSNLTSRNHLLRQARQKRPNGIYLSEFLTTEKLSLFYRLRQMKRQHPAKIKSVFTRGGNIYYRLSDSDRITQVSSLQDLSGIVQSEPSSTVNPST